MAGLAANSNVLVIAVARIGDTVLGTPAMRALKQAVPEGRLTVLAHPKRVEVLRHLPFIDRLGAIDKLSAWWKGRPSREEHDAAIVFGRERPLVEYALRVARRVVVYDEPLFPAHERLVRVPVQEGNHAVLDRLRLTSALGVETAERGLAYQVTEPERSAARDLLSHRWPSPRGPVIGLQMASFATKSHRDWPAQSFSSLADRLCTEQPGARFVVLGDKYARDLSAPFVQRHGERTLISAGTTTLREAAALIGELDLYVGVDTGPTHIAGALRVPMVALYHSLYPGRLLGPLDHPRCRVIECEGPEMGAISVDAVHLAARDLLRTHAGATA
jgi:heptosyltransferase-3